MIGKVVCPLVFQNVSFLLAAALLPPALVLLMVYKMDRLEREPLPLLLGLFFRGAVAMVPILVLELLADQFIDFFPWSRLAYLFLAYFVVPGFIEEGVKYRVLIRRCWREPNFNYRFDAVVYGVFVSLGFAAGAMLYVVVEELIPEASEGEHSNLGTLAFAAGFTVMLALDVALG